jgi:UDP-glucose 4-epimerase
VLVTGGAGFIGSHLTDRFLADGHEVVVVDNLSGGQEANLREAFASGRCRLIEADVTTPAAAAVVAEARPDVLVHLAAQIDVRVSVADPVRDATANVLGTVTMLEAARRAGARKVLLASSVAVYGPPVRLPVTETDPTNPLSPYATSKLAGELYLRQYHRLHGLDTTSMVLSNVYGPRQNPHGEAGVIAIFTDAMVAGRPTMLFGEGGNTRDYVYVGDVVEAFAAAAAPPGGGAAATSASSTAGMRINVGTGVATTDRDLHAIIAAATGATAEPEWRPARLGDLPDMLIDWTLARETLGWRPRTSLAEGVAATVAWAKEAAA